MPLTARTADTFPGRDGPHRRDSRFHRGKVALWPGAESIPLCCRASADRNGVRSLDDHHSQRIAALNDQLAPPRAPTGRPFGDAPGRRHLPLSARTWCHPRRPGARWVRGTTRPIHLCRCRKNYAGTSPLTIVSGRTRPVLSRAVSQQRLCDAIDPSAFCTLTTSPGARQFYDQHRAAGDIHHQALRAQASVSSESSTAACATALTTKSWNHRVNSAACPLHTWGIWVTAGLSALDGVWEELEWVSLVPNYAPSSLYWFSTEPSRASRRLGAGERGAQARAPPVGLSSSLAST